jgi:hypothetical protein
MLTTTCKDTKKINNMAFLKKIFSISSETEFNDMALEMFDFQMQNNPLYAEFVNGIRGAGYEVRGVRCGEATSHLAPRTSHPKHYTEIPCFPHRIFQIPKNPD